MDRKIALAAVIIFTLLGSLVAGLQAVDVAKANWIPSVSIDFIKSPTNGTIYQSSPALDVVIFFSFWYNRSLNVAYSLDGKSNQTLTGTFSPQGEKGVEIFRGSTLLPKLSDGVHNVVVYAWVDAQDSQFEEFGSRSAQIYFKINSTATESPQPSPTVALPTPTLSPTSSPTQTPTLEPSPIVHNNTYDDYTPMIIIIALVIVAVIVGLLVYFAKYNGWK